MQSNRFQKFLTLLAKQRNGAKSSDWGPLDVRKDVCIHWFTRYSTGLSPPPRAAAQEWWKIGRTKDGIRKEDRRDTWEEMNEEKIQCRKEGGKRQEIEVGNWGRKKEEEENDARNEGLREKKRFVPVCVCSSVILHRTQYFTLTHQNICERSSNAALLRMSLSIHVCVCLCICV